MNFYNRVGHVELVSPSSGVTSFSGLDFKFNLKMIVEGNVLPYGDVSILGLNREHVNMLSTARSAATNIAENNIMRVYVGYQDSGENLLFSGTIMRSSPQIPPDNWLTATLVSNPANSMNSEKVYSFSVNKGVNIRTLVNTVGSRLGLKVVFMKYADNSFLETKLGGFTIEGKPNEIIKKLNDLGPMLFYAWSGCLYVTKKDSKDNPYDYSGDIVEISEKTGMVGIPNITWPLLHVTTFINPELKPQGLVNLTSIMNPKANGRYRINSIDYSGHFRGEEWYAKIEATSLGNG